MVLKENSSHVVATKGAHLHNVSCYLLLAPITILPRISFLIMCPLNKTIVQCSKRCTETRPNPVNPMITGEAPPCDRTSETARRIEGSSSIIYA